jgi:hypothetical protein
LKASGDYLPVTGFDPWTGEWGVLTPTDTISSDMTSLSTKENIARLRQRVQNAKLAFDFEKRRRESNKAQGKLEKIEKLKGELRQDQPVKWRQHRGQWSSAAEPNLSPIAQSLASSVPSSELILTTFLSYTLTFGPQRTKVWQDRVLKDTSTAFISHQIRLSIHPLEMPAIMYRLQALLFTQLLMRMRNLFYGFIAAD